MGFLLQIGVNHACFITCQLIISLMDFRELSRKESQALILVFKLLHDFAFDCFHRNRSVRGLCLIKFSCVFFMSYVFFITSKIFTLRTHAFLVTHKLLGHLKRFFDLYRAKFLRIIINVGFDFSIFWKSLRFFERIKIFIYNDKVYWDKIVILKSFLPIFCMRKNFISIDNRSTMKEIYVGPVNFPDFAKLSIIYFFCLFKS